MAELNAEQRAKAIRDQIAAKRIEVESRVSNPLTDLQTDVSESKPSSSELSAELLEAAQNEIAWLRQLEDVLDVVTGRRDRARLELKSTESLTLTGTISETKQEDIRPY